MANVALANEEIRTDRSAVHPLTPLLAPRSIALVGASTQQEAAGNDMVLELLKAGYQGRFYPINPKYKEVEGVDCYPSLSSLPETVDLVVLAVGNARIEAQLKEAIRLGIRAAVIFGSGHLDEDLSPPLLERIRQLAKDAGMLVCGGNCLGFYNLEEKIRVFPQHLPRQLEAGGVTFISQSGAVLTSLLWNDQKLRFNLAVSTGQELVNTVADYMDYALEQPSTRVIAIFLETVRDPECFIRALKKANCRRIPVVVLKAGRTKESAALAMSHSGAIAGDDAVYQALFDRYGVIRVNSISEMAATTQLLSLPKTLGYGDVAAINDSGGEIEVLMDLASEIGVSFTKISPVTTAILKQNLDPGLEPINPLDAWGTGNNYQAIYENCWQALMDDPGTAIGIFAIDLTSGFWLHEALADVCHRVGSRSNKPVAIMTNYAGTNSQDLTMRMIRAGVPVFDGTETTLKAIKYAMAYRDFLARPQDSFPSPVSDEVRLRWRERLAQGEVLDEFEGLELLADYGVPTQPSRIVVKVNDAIAAAEEIGYPVVLKTAMPGIQHKSDVGGVKLGLKDPNEVRDAYADLESRLGSRVLISQMAKGSVEMAFGVLSDPQFGSLVMIATGGIFIELLRDRQVAMAPLGKFSARHLIDGLAMRPLLDGLRGNPACNVASLTYALSRLSLLARDLGDLIAEMDVNPVKVDENGCVAVDALVVPHQKLAAAFISGNRESDRIKPKDKLNTSGPSDPEK